MVLKTTFLFLFAASQVFATSVLQLRSLENLISRQAPCNICQTLSDTVSACMTVGCVCNANIASEVQACITCGVGNNPTPSGTAAAQNLIDAFEATCSGVPGLPSPTIPGVPSPTISGTPATPTTPSSSIPPITSPILKSPVVVSTFSTPTKIIQSTVSSDTTKSIGLPATSPTPPGGTTNGAGRGRGRHAGLFAIGVMVGAVLAL